MFFATGPHCQARAGQCVAVDLVMLPYGIFWIRDFYMEGIKRLRSEEFQDDRRGPCVGLPLVKVACCPASNCKHSAFDRMQSRRISCQGAKNQSPLGEVIMLIKVTSLHNPEMDSSYPNDDIKTMTPQCSPNRHSLKVEASDEVDQRTCSAV